MFVHCKQPVIGEMDQSGYQAHRDIHMFQRFRQPGWLPIGIIDMIPGTPPETTWREGP